jgi:hypothetical protein
MQNSFKMLLVAVTAITGLGWGIFSTSVGTTEDVSTMVAATLHALGTPAPAVTPSVPSPVSPTASLPGGIPASSAGVTMVIPSGLASGDLPENVAAVNDQSGAPWEVAPAYLRFTLQGYALQGKFFQPQIEVYPAKDYADLGTGAAISIQRLQAILASPSAALSNDTLPRLPWANADQMIGAQAKIIGFNRGNGVRVLAEYAQYDAPINNHELFYHFEGLTTDGKSYIVATLPINAAFLAADSNPTSPVPADGIRFPGTDVTDPAVWRNYYQAVTAKLNATSPDAFQPTLTSLDALIQSLQVSH